MKSATIDTAVRARIDTMTIDLSLLFAPRSVVSADCDERARQARLRSLGGNRRSEHAWTRSDGAIY